MDTDQSSLMRIREVAASLGIGRSMAYELAASGRLPVVRIGRAVRVPRAALDEWIKRQTRQSDDSSESAQ